ncbi:basic proline-rich protein-like [Pipistrellus kuhlii]|uniref:basic proline-rich protein-like n=1 Tax=Pipistrellus kuhlii TaxID=59472 RepID=UPI001E270750|nr:basic proline-rich protein-like [Pipistrellus kuhlii]
MVPLPQPPQPREARGQGGRGQGGRLPVSPPGHPLAPAWGTEPENPAAVAAATAARVGRGRAAPGVPPLPASNGALTARWLRPPQRRTPEPANPRRAPRPRGAASRRPSPGAGSEEHSSRRPRTSSGVRAARAPTAGSTFTCY